MHCDMASPLTDLTRKSARVRVVWSLSCDRAFEDLMSQQTIAVHCLEYNNDNRKLLLLNFETI